jgi:O-antigen ligase
MASPQLRSRFYIWQDALDLVIRHPLGIGVGATGGVGGRFQGYGVVDNLYLKLSVELGWLGVLLFGFVAWQAARRGWRVYTRCPGIFDKLIAISAMGFLTVILVDGIVAPSLEYDISTILFWFWLGVLDRVPQCPNLPPGASATGGQGTDDG